MSDPYTDSEASMKDKEPSHSSLLISASVESCDCALCLFIREGNSIPGRGAKKKRFNAWIQQNGKCAYCKTMLANWDLGVMEHLIPKSKGGKSTFLACKKCDEIKKNYSTEEEFDEAIRRLTVIKKKLLEHAKKTS